MAPTARRGAQRNGERGQTQKPALDRGRNCPGVQHVVAQVRAVIHARHHHVMFIVEVPRNREMDAVGRGAGDVVDAGLGLEDAQGHIQRERIARATAIAIRGHHGDRHVGERGESLPQASNAFRTEAVVVAYQYLHSGGCGG